MEIEVKVPPLPESVSDATVAAWHKKPGEKVAADENLVDLETDKVVLEVPAPAGGVLSEVLVGAGENVVAGKVLARLRDAAAPSGAPAGGEHTGERKAASEAPTAPIKAAATAPPMGPAARRLVEAHGLNPADIQGSGRHGRILKEDVLAHVDRQAASRPGPPETPSQPATGPGGAGEEYAASGMREEKRVPMTRLRARIAERLVQAQQQAAMLTTFNEVDMQAVIELRARYRDRFEKTHGVRLGFMSFFVMAAVAALKRFPVINASIDGHDIVYHGYYDIGVAVSSPRGLVVPILRDADLMSMAEIERRIGEYAARARNNSLSLEDITGGTFTLSNGGVFGSLMSTPILNPPESAILGMHKIQERPVAIDGQVVIRPMMYLALSYDHRLIDGREAVQFLVAIKEAIEDPSRLLLEL